jgi:prefoldin subunit 5
MPVTRILLTGDLLRPHTADPSRSESVARIRWFEDLLRPALSLVTDLPVRRLACEPGGLDFQALYRACGVEPSQEAWAALYAGELTPALRDHLLDACRDALLISIEMPPSLAQLFADAGVPLLDCMVHPLRFLYDIPLGWRSTDPAVRAAFVPFGVTPFDVQRRVAQIKAKARWMPPPPCVPDGATLVLDQLQTDAAVIDPRRRRSVTWEDYLEELAALTAQGPVLWRPHPYNPEREVLTEWLGTETQTSANFYHLLTDDRLQRVAAISSGGIVEARAFGKEGVLFLDRHAGITFPDWANPVPVVGHWLSPHFWSAVLAPLIETRREVPALEVERDFFRRASNVDWDFGWIDQIVDRRSQVDQQLRELDARTRALDAGVHAIAAQVQDLSAWTERLDIWTRRLDELSQGLVARTSGLDERTTGLDERTLGLDARTLSLDAHARGVDERMAGVDDRMNGLDSRTLGFDARTLGLDERTLWLDSRLQDVEHKIQEIAARAEAVEQQATELTRQRDAMLRRAEIDEQQLRRLQMADRDRVRALIRDLVRPACLHQWRIGVFGAGAHTEWLFRETELRQVPSLFLFDSNTAVSGRTLAGLPIRPVTDIPTLDLQAVVVSSLAFQDEMAAYLESLPLRRARIIRCYP